MAVKKRKHTSTKGIKTGRSTVQKNKANMDMSVNRINLVEETSIPSVEVPSVPKVTNPVTLMGTPSSPSIFNPVNISLLIVAVISLAVAGVVLFVDLSSKSNDRFLWGVFTLISAALSCFIGAIIALATQRWEASKENDLLQRIKDLFTDMINENTQSLTDRIDEITSNVSLIQDVLHSEFNMKLIISSKQDDLIKKLMDQSLKNRRRV